MHAVVVDPSRVVLKLVSELITERGNAVTAFHDSASALDAIRSDPTVDVLITSLEVQPMSGLELCWEARTAISARRPLYIVVMSSRSDHHMLTEALDCGADDLVAKPVSRLELQARLRLAGRLAAAQLRLVRFAETDPLTGLLNRRAFFERLDTALRSNVNLLPLSAILFDIDHFKRINDTYGHDVGDAVIRGIAEEAARRADLVGRLGGEEFAIVFQGASEAQTFRFAEDLRQACENLSFSADGAPFRVTCSFGISGWSEGETADQMLKKADIALYQAKSEGRNRVCIGGSALPLLPADQPRGIIRGQRRNPI